MRNFFLLGVVVLLILAAIGVALLGAFPPEPQPHTVQKVLPNDRFQTH
jgi:hypothetical protein